LMKESLRHWVRQKEPYLARLSAMVDRRERKKATDEEEMKFEHKC
jgi:hypothetical protein